jgi:ferredoxin
VTTPTSTSTPTPTRDGETHTVVVDHGTGTARLAVEHGTVLRNALREAGISPHSAAGRRVNCGGRGLCATCGVRLEDPPDPDHWHDSLAARFGYPRLSCQVRVTSDLSVRIPDKLVWGSRE